MANLAKKENMDLLSGSIWKKVLAFAVPLALTSILQQLFNAADIAVVGQFAGKNAMAAVGCNSPVIGLFNNLFVGLSVGANVVIARYIGQNNVKSIRKAVHTSVVIALCIGVVITGLGNIAAYPIVHALGVPTEIAPYAIKYLRIYFCGMPFIVLYNFEAAILRSYGDTRTPLKILAIAGVINVALNLCFVILLHMDVAGVALATALSNVVSSSLLFRHLLRIDSIIGINIKELCVDKRILDSIIRIGAPSGLQGMVFSFSNMIVQSAINSLGADVMAGSAAAFNVEIIAFFVLNAFSQSAVTFVGQNYGAGNIKRCTDVTKQVLIINAIAMIIVGVIFILIGKYILLLFSSEAVVIGYGYTRIVIIMSTEIINAVNETLSGAMRGYGQSLKPALVALVGICGTRLLWVFTVFKKYHTYAILLTLYPVSWVVEFVLMIIVYINVRKNIINA